MLSRWVILPLVGLAFLAGQAVAAGSSPAKEAKKAAKAEKKPGPEQGLPKNKPAPQRKAKKARPGEETPKAAPCGTARQPGPQPPSPTKQSILRALGRPIQLEFVETPLADVLNFLQECMQIPVKLDVKGIADIGVAADAPITFSARGISARTALDLMLRDVNLLWIVFDEEVLLITTPEVADQLLATVVYDVHDLVAAQDEKGKPVHDFDSLIDAITNTVLPTTWDAVGGPGSIEAFEGNGIAALVVSQTQQVHEKIEKLLADLRKVSRVKPGEPVRLRTIRPKAAAKEAKGPFVEGFPGSPPVSAQKPEAKPQPGK